MFIDEVVIHVQAGDGGNGMVAFRREKFVPDGGPAGGDGGKGADIVFVVEEGMRTLMDFRYKKQFRAESGENGRSKNQHGKNAPDSIIKVPPGTIIYDQQSGAILADLVRKDQRFVVAKGGRGGRGNTRFATPSNPAPTMAENGEPGQELELRLELKLLADAGLIGFPNVGKSTLLSIVSAARPKIANYHFTTIQPNLGVVEVEQGVSFVLADMPGLIEGAHEGTGLGHQFLRHIERTRLLVHVVDMSATEGRDPFEDYEQINSELRQYTDSLAQKPQIIVANKMDVPEAEGHLRVFKEKLGESGVDAPVYPVSAAINQGIKELIFKINDMLETLPERELAWATEVEQETEQQLGHVTYTFQEEEADFYIERDEDEVFVVNGAKIERLFKMTNFNYEEGVRRFARTLRNMGVDAALREKGAQDGDTVRIMDYEFEFVE